MLISRLQFSSVKFLTRTVQVLNFSMDKMAGHASDIKINKNARVIVRNLPYASTVETLRSSFGKYGKIHDVNLPQKNGQPAGFGFINFKSVNSVDMACRHMHNSVLNGRTIQVTPALAKQIYDQKRLADAQLADIDGTIANEDIKVKSETENADDIDETSSKYESADEKKLLHAASKLRNARKRKLVEEELAADTEDGGDGLDAECHDAECASTAHDTATTRQLPRKAAPTNVSKTLFVRNIPFDATPETLRPVFEPYGKVEYALPCKDRATDVPRGTAFVRYYRAADMERALAATDPHTGEMRSGGELGGRKLRICTAVFREKVTEVATANAVLDRGKSTDKRNLYLINVGTVMRNTPDIRGVSESDMKKRDMLQQRKKVALKDLHVFISPTRLSIHNLPKSCDDAKLRSILLDAVNHEGDAKLKECRVMRDLKRLDAPTGKPISKGFGFAEFSTHDYAMKALLAVNNNPDIFHRDRRPIVEFSLENRNALLIRKRRLEHSQLRQGQLNEIKVRQKFGVPLNADDHATLAGKRTESKKSAESSKKQMVVKGKQHVNRSSNRGLASWNKPKNKKKRIQSSVSKKMAD